MNPIIALGLSLLAIAGFFGWAVSEKKYGLAAYWAMFFVIMLANYCLLAVLPFLQ
jgi:hypothetical protein